MSTINAIFVIDDTVQEGQESVVAMIPDLTEDAHGYHTIYKLRPIITSLTDVAHTIHGTKAVSATINLGPQLDNTDVTISKIQNLEGFSIGVALSNVDRFQCRMLANNVMESLRYLFGKLTVSDLIQNLDRVKVCLMQYTFALNAPDDLWSRKNTILFDGLTAGVKPSLVISKRLCSEFSSLQSSQASNDSAFTLLPRPCFPIGSCFFWKGLCLHTSMTPIDLFDTARFCLLNGLLSRTENDGLFVQFKQNFSTSLEKRIISIVSWGHSIVCMLFHCSNETTLDSHIDPFCVAEMKSFLHDMDADLSDQIDDEITRMERLAVSLADIPLKLVSRPEDKESNETPVVVSPKPKPAPSSPIIRRKTIKNVTQESKSIGVDRRLAFVGVETCILRFRIVDRYCKLVTEAPFVSEELLDIQIAAFFGKAVAILQHKLAKCSFSSVSESKDDAIAVKEPIVKVKANRETGEAKNFHHAARMDSSQSILSKFAAEESSLHFQITSALKAQKSNAMQRLGFVVVGRVFPPHHEVYLCVEDSTPKDVLSLAFQLVFAWT